MAVNITDPSELRGVNVVGASGDKLGKVDEVYLDNETGAPEWAAVKTGLFGSNVSLVPLAAADYSGSELTVPFGKDQVKNAPNHDPGREISIDDEKELFTYYGISYGGDTVTATGGPGSGDTGYQSGTDTTTQSSTSTTGDSGYSTTDTTQSTAGTDRRDRSGDAGIVGRDTSGPTTDDAMTRSEERLHVGTENREAGRARLRKYITSETVSQTVPVSHEELRVEREPITDANAGDALAGSDLTEEEHEVTLHEERPVVAKETVPVERIRLDKETVTEQQTVSDEVRKENIELEDGTTTTTGTTRDR